MKKLPTPSASAHKHMELERSQRSSAPESIFDLQRRGGNRATQELLNVRVHRDAEAARLTRTHGALGLARNLDVYVAPEIEPASALDDYVVAHELTHVRQQALGRDRAVHSSESELEREAEAAVDSSSGSVINAAPPDAPQLADELPLQVINDRIIPELLADKHAWKKYLNVPAIASALRENSRIQHAYSDDVEFQRWMKDPTYRPAAIAPTPQVRPAVDRPTQMSESATRVTSPTGYYDDAGNPVYGPVTERASESLGLRVVQPTPFSLPDWSKENNALTPEQRARGAYPQRTTPLQRRDADRRPSLPRFLTKEEQSLHESEEILKMVPFARISVHASQAMWGSDLIGNPVNRWDALGHTFEAIVLDGSMLVGPEALMEVGVAKAPLTEAEIAAVQIAKREAGGGLGSLGRETAAEIPPVRAMDDVLAPPAQIDELPIKVAPEKEALATADETAALAKQERPPPRVQETPRETSSPKAEPAEPAIAPKIEEPQFNLADFERKRAEQEAELNSLRKSRENQNRDYRRAADSAKPNIENPIDARIRRLEAETSQDARFARDLEPGRTGETVSDIEDRWFRQRGGENFEAYQQRMRSYRSMVEEEALRSEEKLELAFRHDELIAGFEERATALREARRELESAGNVAREIDVEARKLLDNQSKRPSGSLTIEEQELQKIQELANKELARTERLVNRLDLGIDAATGKIGEDLVRQQLGRTKFTNIRAIQNASDHGIDLVAEKDGLVYFFEIKSTEGARAPALKIAQRDSVEFVMSRLEASGPGNRELIKFIKKNPEKVRYQRFEVTNVNVANNTGSISEALPW